VSSGKVVAVLAGIGSSVLALLYAPAVVRAQGTPREPIPLSVDQRSDATQRADEPIVYRFTARAGESYFIEVEQRGLDLIVTVEAPNGSAQSYNSPLLRDEREYAVFDAAVAGDYRIDITSNELTNALGGHSILVSKFAEAETARSQAWRSMSTAATLNAEADRARLEQTLEQTQVDILKKSSRDSYARAGELWQQLGERRLHAQALYSTAMLEYWDLYNWPGGVDLAKQAAAAYGGVDENLRVRTQFLATYASVDAAGEMDREAATATYEAALRTYADIAAMYEQRGDEYALAEVLRLIGATHYERGDFVQAGPLWQRSASIFSSIGEWHKELRVQQNLAAIAGEQGYPGKAIETFRYILERLPAGRDPDLEATVLQNLGASSRNFGDIDRALQAYSRALVLRQRAGDATHISAALRGLGSTYYVSGDYERARNYLQQALTSARSVGDGRSQAAILTYLGNIAYLEGDFTAALALHRDAESLTNSAQGRAVRQLLTAKDLTALGHHAEALAAAEEVAGSSADLPIVVADAHAQIGRTHLASGEHEAATDHLQRALTLYRSLSLQEGEADALNGLALAAQGSGRTAEAVAYGEAALDRIESLRVKVTAPELRALYTAAQRSFYETQIDILLSGESAPDEHVLAALSVSERARARTLVDLLSAARVESRDPVDAAVTANRNRLYDDLAARSFQRDSLLAAPLTDVSTKEELDRVLREIAALENELTLLETQQGENRTLSADVLTGAEIQRSLDADAVLLQYELGQRRSVVWVVTRDSVRVVELAPRGTIEAAARNVLSSLQTSTPAVNLDQQLKALSDHVLAPISDLIQAERVLVAADGALHYVPFTVLPVAHDGVSAPLIATREVVSVPSMSALAAQRVRRRPDEPGQTLAVFADPVFERTDERLVRLEASVATPPPEESLDTRSAALGLRRLRYSAHEAESIAALVPETARLVSEGFGATRDRVLSTDLSQYRYVHFATHGLVDSRNPALSALALSQFDQRGNALAGLLRLNDIYNLDLNADLVVLSACDTALGREIRGEGLVGLTQAFLYAGARGLVLSLWQVSDAATATLMARFYDHMLAEGASPADALRAAQLSMAAEPRWASPYYWGAFVLVGDVR
jgi:CHAT domain-containing protein